MMDMDCMENNAALNAHETSSFVDIVVWVGHRSCVHKPCRDDLSDGCFVGLVCMGGNVAYETFHIKH